uniref:RNA-dependent RNA polymerase n=1 Tax=Erysiphales associated mitovirus 1 TaxID=2719863 RepID=A0A6G9ENM3_9VIRU|nr:RNA-dependent RNA polymerase [Erysiphales associated mitovirus 1]
MSRRTINSILLTRLIKQVFRFDGYLFTWRYIEVCENLRRTRGLLQAVKQVKAMRLHITRFVCGKPLKSNNSHVGLDKTGWPTRLDFLKVLLKDNRTLRVLMTLLSYTKSWVPDKKEAPKVKPDYSTIDNPSTVNTFYTVPRWFIKYWVSYHKLNLPKPVFEDSDHYISMKMSPNGPSSISSLWSWKALTPQITDSLKYFIGEYWGKFSDYWDDVNLSNLEGKKIKNLSQTRLGKLAIKPDPECKQRVIAMVDYHSQFTLRKIHDQIFSLLKKFDTDRTFNQNPFANWEVNKEYFYSLDLSAATDRFPIHLQKKLLSVIYDDNTFGREWVKLLTDRDYYDPEGNIHRYSVGQPMGAYSSWAVFALTHHLVVAWAAFKARKLSVRFNQYILLGDDIVIKDRYVASQYITIMNRLGVEVSPHKTHVSPHTYEFAKRWIREGVEITGLQLKGILTNFDIQSAYNSIASYLREVSTIGNPIMTVITKSYDRIPYRIGKKTFKSSPSGIAKQLYDFNIAMRFGNGLTYEELRSYLSKWIRDPNYITPPELVIRRFLRAIFSEVVQNDMFTFMMGSKNRLGSLINGLEKWSVNGVQGKVSPMVLGFIGTIKRTIKQLEASPADDFNLLEESILIRFPDTDKLVQIMRNPQQNYNYAASVWKKMMKIIRAGFNPEDVSLATVHFHLTTTGDEEQRQEDYQFNEESEDCWWESLIFNETVLATGERGTWNVSLSNTLDKELHLFKLLATVNDSEPYEVPNHLRASLLHLMMSSKYPKVFKEPRKVLMRQIQKGRAKDPV